MLTKIKNPGVMLVLAVAVVSLGGCVIERHGHRRYRQPIVVQERVVDHADLNIRIH